MSDYLIYKSWYDKNATEWAKNNPDKRKEIMRKYNSKPDVKSRKREWYLKNREKLKEKSRLWNINNPEKKKEIARKYAHKKYFGGNRPTELKSCKLCGSDYRLHVHHRDGNNGRNGNAANHSPDNLVVLCNPCHSKVHNHGKIRILV